MSRSKGSLNRHNLERRPYSVGDSVMQLTAMKKNSRGSWAIHNLWGKMGKTHCHTLFLGACSIGPQLLN